MSPSRKKLAVYIEIGSKRTVAGAIDWPGWSRSARDETAALQAFVASGTRYARVANASHLDVPSSIAISEVDVVERLQGNATTDMGVPALAPSADARPLSSAELERLQAILNACWRVFDATVKKARGKELRKGPRGGGRDLDRIIQHVVGADEAYLGALGYRPSAGDGQVDAHTKLARTRKTILEGLDASVRGEIPSRGPRGGLRWSPRYFVRRVAYHVLDHAWEIEDRLV